MRRPLRLGLTPAHWVVILVVALLAAACQPPAGVTSSSSSGTGDGSSESVSPVDSGPALAVIGTENFYADLLTQIGGSRVQAASFLNDPNADPHAFETSTQDAVLVADARLVIVNGLGYDAFMQKLLGASSQPDRQVIDVQQLLGRPDDANVHVWYDPATMPRVAAAVTDALTKLDPQNAGYFAGRLQGYLAALAPITDKVRELKAKYAGTPIAFTEDVAGYLTDQIGLDLKSPIGFMKSIEEGTDPAPADVAAERDLFTQKAVKVLLYNSQVTSPTTQQIHDLATANGIAIVGVAETIPPAFKTFQDWQLAQLAELEHALAGGG